MFEEFRSELGEGNKVDEDLETHYNLGIAYREMGLLEEAISEFQKVASADDKAPAFRIEEATIDDLHAAIQDGRATCVSVVEHYLARVRAYNGPASCTRTLKHVIPQ